MIFPAARNPRSVGYADRPAALSCLRCATKALCLTLRSAIRLVASGTSTGKAALTFSAALSARRALSAGSM